MKIQELLQKREELNYELIEAVSSKQINAISNEIFDIEAQIELASGKNIAEVDAEYGSANASQDRQA